MMNDKLMSKLVISQLFIHNQSISLCFGLSRLTLHLYLVLVADYGYLILIGIVVYRYSTRSPFQNEHVAIARFPILLTKIAGS